MEIEEQIAIFFFFFFLIPTLSDSIVVHTSFI